MKKQGTEQLEKSLTALQWQRTTHPEKLQVDLDESAIHAILTACVLRNMKKFDDARDILKNEILSHDRYVSSLIFSSYVPS